MKRYTLARRIAVAGAALTAALALTACTGTGSSAVPAPRDAGSSNASSATVNTMDVMFARMMIVHHQQAIQMADLAQTRASDPRVKKLAAQIKTAQTAEIATMKGWLAAWGQPTTMPSMPGGMMPSGMPGGMTSSSMPGGMTSSSMPGRMMPSGMASGMPGMMSNADMARLAAARGTTFNRQFLQMMIVHHRGAIQMARAEQAHGVNPQAKALAARIIADQQAQIDTMQKMLPSG